jgi:hypothetical protein
MESTRQKRKVKRVMHEFKHGELKSAGGGRKVKSRKQAIAIAMSESGLSRQRGRKAKAASGRRKSRARSTSASRSRKRAPLLPLQPSQATVLARSRCIPGRSS